MSSFIPMVSSSPPPMDEGGGFDWNEDDDDFGNFASADNSISFQSAEPALQDNITNKITSQSFTDSNWNQSNRSNPKADNETFNDFANFASFSNDQNGNIDSEVSNTFSETSTEQTNTVKLIENTGIVSDYKSPVKDVIHNSNGMLTDSGLYSSDVSPVSQLDETIGIEKTQGDSDSLEDLSINSPSRTSQVNDTQLDSSSLDEPPTDCVSVNANVQDSEGFEQTNLQTSQCSGDEMKVEKCESNTHNDSEQSSQLSDSNPPPLHDSAQTSETNVEESDITNSKLCSSPEHSQSTVSKTIPSFDASSHSSAENIVSVIDVQNSALQITDSSGTKSLENNDENGNESQSAFSSTQNIETDVDEKQDASKFNEVSNSDSVPDLKDVNVNKDLSNDDIDSESNGSEHVCDSVPTDEVDAKIQNADDIVTDPISSESDQEDNSKCTEDHASDSTDITTRLKETTENDIKCENENMIENNNTDGVDHTEDTENIVQCIDSSDDKETMVDSCSNGANEEPVKQTDNDSDTNEEFDNFGEANNDFEENKIETEFGKPSDLNDDFGEFGESNDDFGNFNDANNDDDFGNFNNANADFGNFNDTNTDVGNSGSGGFADFGSSEPSQSKSEEKAGDWASFSEPQTTSTVNIDDDDEEWAGFADDDTDTSTPQSSSVPPEQTKLQSMNKEEKIVFAVTSCFTVRSSHIEASVMELDMTVEEAEESEKTVWYHLKGKKTSNSMTFQYPKSKWNNQLYTTLHVDTRNVLIGHKKASVPIFASGLTLLEPTKGLTEGGTMLQPDVLIDTTKPDVIPTLQSQVPSKPVVKHMKNETIPPAQFDWSGSGLTNPLEASNKTLNLDFLIQDQATKSSALESEFLAMHNSPIHKPAIQPLENILANLKTSSTFKLTNQHEDVGSEAGSILEALPSLSFMKSKVLRFPINLSK